LPIYPQTTSVEEEEAKKDVDSGPKVITKTVILDDGSYGQKTIVVDESKQKSD
jgi:hypothetical protein